MSNGALDYFQVLIMCLSSFLYLRNFSIKRNEACLYLLIISMFISVIYTKVLAITYKAIPIKNTYKFYQLTACAVNLKAPFRVLKNK